MNAQNTAPSSQPPRATQGSQQSQPKPWRTEGLPKGQPSKRRRWVSFALWGVGYLALFGLLTMQDRLAQPQAVSYTEFKAQVAAGNVAEVFARGDTIEGELKKPAPLPAPPQSRSYKQFKTE